MKVWQRFFLSTLVLLMAAISTMGLYMLSRNYDASLQRTRRSGILAFDLLVGQIQSSLVYERYQQQSTQLGHYEVLRLVNRLAQSFSRQNIAFSGRLPDGVESRNKNAPPDVLRQPATYLELYLDQTRLLSSLPAEIKSLSDQGQRPELEPVASFAERRTLIRRENQQNWLFVSGQVRLENEDYTLVIVQSVDTIMAEFSAQRQLLTNLMLVLSLAVTCILLILVIWQTRSLTVMSRFTTRIANGDYSIRLQVSGSDELSELGRDFNQMADAVSRTVDELEKANLDRSNFIDNLGHELKTPLTSIIGFSDLMRQGQDLPEKRRQQAGLIHQEGLRLQHISRLLMQLSNLRHEALELSAVDLAELLDSVVVLNQPLADQYDLSLEAMAEPGEIRVNPDLFRSLLGNLIENAAKASAPGTRIQLQGLLLQPGGYQISVQDQGAGIPQHELEKIRQPFYTLDKARTRQAGGAGLGLAICDQIARVHGAGLRIESQVGQGTRVTILKAPGEAT